MLECVAWLEPRLRLSYTYLQGCAGYRTFFPFHLISGPGISSVYSCTPSGLLWRRIRLSLDQHLLFRFWVTNFVTMTSNFRDALCVGSPLFSMGGCLNMLWVNNVHYNMRQHNTKMEMGSYGKVCPHQTFHPISSNLSLSSPPTIMKTEEHFTVYQIG